MLDFANCAIFLINFEKTFPSLNIVVFNWMQEMKIILEAESTQPCVRYYFSIKCTMPWHGVSYPPFMFLGWTALALVPPHHSLSAKHRIEYHLWVCYLSHMSIFRKSRLKVSKLSLCNPWGGTCSTAGLISGFSITIKKGDLFICSLRWFSPSFCEQISGIFYRIVML